MSYSQDGSDSYPKLQSDGTTVVSADQVASLNVYKDECDFAKEELEATKVLVIKVEANSKVQDKEIKNLEGQNKLLGELKESKDDQIKILKDALSMEKLKKLGSKILLWASLALNLFLVIRN